MESINKLFLLIIVLLSVSCVQQTGQFTEEDIDLAGSPIPNIPAGSGSGSGGTTEDVEANNISGVHIKNFNQINMSFSKLTGIDRSRQSVVDVMSQILNQLPASNDLSSFTPFHQISITRLAFTYCELFIDEDSTFSSLDYSRVTSDAIADGIIERFLDEAPSDEPEKYDVLRSEMISILDNEDQDQAGKLVDESGVSRSDLMRRLSKMSCSMVLSSSFVTLI